MSALLLQIQTLRRSFATSAYAFLAAFILLISAAAILIGSLPLQLSIITIFIFAGPHNIMEFRYFAARMPVRWGRSRGYYSAAIAGVLVLAAAYLTIYFAGGFWPWSPDAWTFLIGFWNTAFILWIGLLFWMRGRRRPRTDWSLAIPIAFFVSGLAWLIPQFFSLGLVYLHPLIALWFLERQIRRTRPAWLRAYHLSLLATAVVLMVLWAALAGSADLPAETGLFWRISQHAGSEILSGISSRVLVATHVFLETVHYFVWLLIIPLADSRAVPWRLNDVPLFANAEGFPKAFCTFLAAGVLLVFALWVGFAADYAATRDIYFAFAIGHVLAEFPFLVKML